MFNLYAGKEISKNSNLESAKTEPYQKNLKDLHKDSHIVRKKKGFFSWLVGKDSTTGSKPGKKEDILDRLSKEIKDMDAGLSKGFYSKENSVLSEKELLVLEKDFLDAEQEFIETPKPSDFKPSSDLNYPDLNSENHILSKSDYDTKEIDTKEIDNREIMQSPSTLPVSIPTNNQKEIVKEKNIEEPKKESEKQIKRKIESDIESKTDSRQDLKQGSKQKETLKKSSAKSDEEIDSLLREIKLQLSREVSETGMKDEQLRNEISILKNSENKNEAFYRNVDADIAKFASKIEQFSKDIFVLKGTVSSFF